MSSHRRGWGAHVGWFLFGAAVGGLTVVLLMRRSGEQHGGLLGEHGTDIARRAHELAADAQDRAGEWLDKSRELVEEQTQRLWGAFEAGREAVRQEMRRGTTTLG